MPVKKIPRKPRTTLTPKQKAFVEAYIKEKNATEAAAQAYKTEDRNTAGSIGTENLQKPAIISALALHESKATNKIAQLVDSKKEEIAYKASTYIHDFVHGKAVQRVLNANLNVNIGQDTDDDELYKILHN